MRSIKRAHIGYLVQESQSTSYQIYKLSSLIMTIQVYQLLNIDACIIEYYPYNLRCTSNFDLELWSRWWATNNSKLESKIIPQNKLGPTEPYNSFFIHHLEFPLVSISHCSPYISLLGSLASHLCVFLSYCYFVKVWIPIICFHLRKSHQYQAKLVPQHLIFHLILCISAQFVCLHPTHPK